MFYFLIFIQFDLYTHEKIEFMFLKVNEKLVYCQLCQTNIEVEEDIEIEFWKHQVQKNHLEQLINFYIFHQKQQTQQRKPVKSNVVWHNNQNESSKKKQAKINQKINNNKQLDLKNSYYDSFDYAGSQLNLRTNMKNRFDSDDDLLQLSKTIEPTYKQHQLSKENYESFKLLTEQYFTQLITDLIQKEYYLEAVCFILARVGLSTNSLSAITFEDVQKEIKNRSQIENEFLIPQLLKMFNSIFPKVESQYYEENNGYLIQQIKPNVILNNKLDKARKMLILTTNDNEYKKFLFRVQVRCFNSQYKSRMQATTQYRQVNINSNQTLQESVLHFSQNDDQEIELQQKITDIVEKDRKNTIKPITDCFNLQNSDSDSNDQNNNLKNMKASDNQFIKYK